MTPEQHLALHGGGLALLGALLLMASAAIALAVRAIRHTQTVWGLVRDRIEEARMRWVFHRVAARNPFDDLQQRAADDRSLTANCACDDQPCIDTRPGNDNEALTQLNALYRAPSWKEQR